MKIVIVGAGFVGFQVARQLIKERKDVVLIEKDPTVARYVANRLDCLVITGSGNNLADLHKAGIDKCDYFISLTDSDEMNMVCCSLVAAHYEEPTKVARVRNIDYLENYSQTQEGMGIDVLINPEIEASQGLQQSLTQGGRGQVLLFDNVDIQIEYLHITADSPFKDQPLQSLGINFQVPFLIPLIHREEEVIIPSGDTMIQEDDGIYLAASPEDFDKIHGFLGDKKPSLKRILIIGGGKIARLLLEQLYQQASQKKVSFIQRLSQFISRENKKQIRIIERDYEKCKILSETFPNATVIHADISDENIFEEEQLDKSDIVITITDNQELNIVAALYAKKSGIRRSIALVNSDNYLRIAHELGINGSVSLKNTMVNAILKYIRKGRITRVQSIADGQAEIIELGIF
jgi:trk system potassium uptake protein TrkA